MEERGWKKTNLKSRNIAICRRFGKLFDALKLSGHVHRWKTVSVSEASADRPTDISMEILNFEHVIL